MPISANSASVAEAGRSITTPSASSTSAEPHTEDAARLPCLTIGTPAEAATIVAIVDTFTVSAPSPPVPTRSVTGPVNLIGVACASIDAARPDISAAVSPLARSATPNPAICAGVALPSMISFMAHAVCSAVSACLPMSARISVGQLGVSIYLLLSCYGRRCGAGAHEGGQLAGERDRVDRVADHRFGLRPGGEPAVVRTADDQQRGRAVVDLVLRLAADPHAAGRLRLAVEHHDVDAARVEQPEQRWRGRHLDDLGVRRAGGRAGADGKPHLGSRVGIMAVNNVLHGEKLTVLARGDDPRTPDVGAVGPDRENRDGIRPPTPAKSGGTSPGEAR